MTVFSPPLAYLFLQDTTSPLADEACMLLSNLTQIDAVCSACLRIDQSTSSDTSESKAKQAVRSLQTLVDLFAKENVNKQANYDYLAHVFANISASNVSLAIFYYACLYYKLISCWFKS